MAEEQSAQDRSETRSPSRASHKEYPCAALLASRATLPVAGCLPVHPAPPQSGTCRPCGRVRALSVLAAVSGARAKGPLGPRFASAAGCVKRDARRRIRRSSCSAWVVATRGVRAWGAA
jgi:hypothetical protein